MGQMFFFFEIKFADQTIGCYDVKNWNSKEINYSIFEIIPSVAKS
jgi:hypothetical protein